MSRHAFEDKALQTEYQWDLLPEKVRLTRISALLATLINVAFVALDTWAIPSALATVWSLRVAMNVIIAGCFFATWHRNFDRHYTLVTAIMFFTLGSGINLMIQVAAPTDLAIDAYYGGLLLTTFGMYTLTYVSLATSMSISVVLLGTYMWVCVFTHNFLQPDKIVVLTANLFFFVSATVLGIVAQELRNRYSRENYLLRHSLERDIELQEAEKRRASHLAHHDGLTGLPNRRSFEDQVGALLRAGTHDNHEAVVLFIDINKFKPINDRHGHLAGDRVLKVIAERLRGTLRATDVVARFGGDEFVACVQVSGDIAPVIRKLHHAIEQPIPLRREEVQLSASIGVARYPEDGETLAALIEHADEHMYQRKHAARHLVAARS